MPCTLLLTIFSNKGALSVKRLSSFFHFYAEGFRNMTWGRPLWILIILKLIILFAVLRVFFFKPVLGGKTDEQKSEYVGTMLTKDHQ